MTGAFGMPRGHGAGRLGGGSRDAGHCDAACADIGHGGEPILRVEGLSCGYDGRAIVHDATFSMARGEFLCVIGANGCGKTTMVKAIMGLLERMGGEVAVDGRSTSGMGPRELARLVAYVPQAHDTPFAFPVSDVVLMGRTPYLGPGTLVSDLDRDMAAAAMEAMGVEDLARRTYTSLSGGQRQLVLIARALAQQPRVLVMDEPASALDYGNQHMLLRHVRALSEMGVSVLMVTHDPNHVLHYADSVVVMEAGRVVETGPVEAVMTTDTIERIYRTGARVVDLCEDGCPAYVCVPQT